MDKYSTLVTPRAWGWNHGPYVVLPRPAARPFDLPRTQLLERPCLVCGQIQSPFSHNMITAHEFKCYKAQPKLIPAEHREMFLADLQWERRSAFAKRGAATRRRNKLKPKLTGVKCDRCGRTAVAPSVHELPLGWERSGYGDDYCSVCTSDINTALGKWSRR